MMDFGEGFTLREGKLTVTIPEARKAGEELIPVGLALKMQFENPDTWGKTYIHTGAAFLTGTSGDVVVDPCSALLYSVDSSTPLREHARLLSGDQWNEARYSESVAHLTADEARNINGQGYVQRGGVWQPRNRAVGYVWDVLANGMDLREHAELAYEKSSALVPSGHVDTVLNLYFDLGERRGPTLRPVAVGSLIGKSSASGNLLDFNDSRLFGVASKTLEQALATRVIQR